MNPTLREIHLGHFKCFRDTRLPLSRLTLLAGMNGAGKSTLLQALLTLRQSHLQGTLSDGRLALSGPLVRLGSGRDVLHVDADPEIITLGLTWGRGNDTSSFFWRFEYLPDARELPRLEENGADDDRRVLAFPPFFDAFCYLAADRTTPQAFFPLADQALAGPHTLGNQGQYTVHYLSHLGDRPIPCPELVHRDESSKSLLRQVEAWLGEIRPGLRLRVEPHDSIDVVELGYQFLLGPTYGEPFRPTNVGFGLTYTIPVLTALLAMEKGGLVLIENPEAHLHPRGQAKIGKLCARAAAAGVQVVLETHSDHVLNGIRIAVREGAISHEDVAIHFFTATSGALEPTILSPQIDAHGKLDRWPEGFFDEWDHALEQLLD